MIENMLPNQNGTTWDLDPNNPVSLTRVMDDLEQQGSRGAANRFKALPTGFAPLDDVLNGGIRPGDLAILAGGYGVGKTILALQIARNVAMSSLDNTVIYVCFEHDRSHLLSRLLCLETAFHGIIDQALTLRRLIDLSSEGTNKDGLISRLRAIQRYNPVLDDIAKYSDRLFLVKASGDYTTLDQIRSWVQELWATGTQHVLLIVDYIQKVQLGRGIADLTEEATVTYVAQSLKEMAMTTNSQIIAVAAADLSGLKSKRMRLSDLRGSSAIQYEADIGLVLNNKYHIVSREHMVYNITHAEAMRNYVVLSVEKNRAGASAVDMEFQLDASHFRLMPIGDFVQDRLIDDKVVLA